MPSPDLSAYIDLSLYDADPQDLFELAQTDLQVKLPDWTPREGQTEVMLLESAALQVSEAVYAINRLPGSLMLIVGQFFGIYRDEGQQPAVTLQFNCSDALGRTIPAGTTAQMTLDSGASPVIFSTDVDLVIPVNSSSGIVTATGDRYTQDANGVAAGAVIVTLETFYYLSNVVTTTVVANGRDPEDDAAWTGKIVQRLSRQTQALVVPSQFMAFALENPLVSRCLVMDNFSPTSGNTPSQMLDTGNITLALYGNNALVASSDKTAILNTLNALVQSNLVVHLIDPTITPVAVTAAVHILPGYVASDVIGYVQTSLANYLNVTTWDWDSIVRRNSLISVINNTVGVDYVSGLTTPSADLTLSGSAPLASAGTFTITTI